MSAPGRARPARVLVADDHAVVREGLKALINREVDLQVVAEATDGREAVAVAAREPLDLAVVDVAMPAMTGLQATRELTRRHAFPVLVLSMYDREEYVAEAIAAGASGYVLKREVDEAVVAAIRAALGGAPFVHPPSMAAVVERCLRRGRDGGAGGASLLTPREQEVAKLIAEGLSSQQIATVLTISVKTVDHHRTNILQKLGASDRVDITRYAIRAGLVEP